MVDVAPRVKIVCMDATHNTTGYSYYLITLMIKDKSGMGCPVGHCICTSEDTTTVEVFLSEVRKKCGHPIIVDYFMSDGARAYHNAWCNVMHTSSDPPSTKPIPVKCMWHILKSWKEQLKPIKDKNVAEYNYIYTCLRTLLQTKNAEMIHHVIIQNA